MKVLFFPMETFAGHSLKLTYEEMEPQLTKQLDLKLINMSPIGQKLYCTTMVSRRCMKACAWLLGVVS